jgi:hypothetical protein
MDKIWGKVMNPDEQPLPYANVKIIRRATGETIAEVLTDEEGRWEALAPAGEDLDQIISKHAYLETRANAGRAGSEARGVVGMGDVEALLRKGETSILTFQDVAWRTFARGGSRMATVGTFYRAGGDILGHTFEYLNIKELVKPTTYHKAMSVAKPLARIGTGLAIIGNLYTLASICIGTHLGKHPDEIAEELGGLEKIWYDYFKAQGWIDPERRRTVVHAMWDWLMRGAS